MTNQKVVKKKHHDLEFRMDAAKMVVEGGRTPSDVAKDVGVTAQSVGAWVKRYRQSKAGGSAVAPGPDALRLKAVLEENRKLKMQVDFLKKTTAYFVKLSE